jgi:peptidyl-prolyl cis-trans isomerase C
MGSNLNNLDKSSFMKVGRFVSLKRVLCGALVLVTVVGLVACGNKEKKAGQALVRVNGEEITVLQVNDELKRAGVKADQQEAASRQLLESLIDRQLIMDEAMRNKIHRTPEVTQAIERAKAQIIAQAYLKRIEAKVAKPSKAEIDNYFLKHPEYFTQRKQYDMQQIVIATKDFSNELRSVIDSAKSLDLVAAWLDRHNVRYSRGRLSRSTADMPEPIVAKIKEMKKSQIFIVNDGENSLLNFITDVKDSPVTLKDAVPQIEQYLINSKTREVADAEIAHLRSLAKIEYLNASAPSVP